MSMKRVFVCILRVYYISDYVGPNKSSNGGLVVSY